MKKLSVSLAGIAALLTLITTLLYPQCRQVPQTTWRCTQVYDGDTITLERNGETQKVRMSGIDAPEKKQTYGEESRQYLAERVLNREVQVEGSTRDKYGRLIGTIYAGGENINLAMVQAGCAWDYVQYNADAAYTRAEREAREAGRGLWAEQNPIAPWQFRHPERYGLTERLASENNRPEATTALYWVSNSGKTHNRNCKNFLGNAGTGHYTNTPSGTNAQCCGGAQNAPAGAE